MPGRVLPAIVVVLSALLSSAANLARADGARFDPAILKKVKAATVHLEVQFSNGASAEGSGFFTQEPGLVVTNAHVLGMLDAASRPPTKITVTINSGEENSLSLPGTLLGVDRDSDLAVLRVISKNLPAPLQVAPAKELQETQEVFIFGFPFGKQLGKNITVSKSSISSMRKVNGSLNQVQVNGGMHPGNSGGPVTTSDGKVIGVAVAVIRGTMLNFAIPGETVQSFLNGKVASVVVDLGWKEGDKVRMPARLYLVDPLGKLRNVALETWVVAPSNTRRPASDTEPPAHPGDGPRQTVPADYNKQAVISMELVLPAKEPSQVYWLRGVYTDGAGQKHWKVAFAPSPIPVERKEIQLTYKPQTGKAQQVELACDGEFRMRLQGEQHTLAMKLKNTMLERAATQKTGDVLPFRITFRGLDISLLLDNKEIQGEPDLDRKLGYLGTVAASVDGGADGAATNLRANLTRVPPDARQILKPVSDQVLQALVLVAVPLPDGTLKPLQKWKVQARDHAGQRA